MSSNFLPNTFSSFNDYVDIAMELLSGDEYKTLSFAARHILGWQEKINRRRGVISLTMFEHGYITEKGIRFGGTGLNRATLLNTTDALTKARLLTKIGKPGPDGQEWELGDDVNWDYLITRKVTVDAKNRERTEKARQGRKAKSAGTSHKPASGMSHKPAGGMSDIPEVVSPTNQGESVAHTSAGMSDIPKQNHLQNHLQNQVVVVEEKDQNAWNACFHQLEMQLDRASFETHLRDAALQHVQRDEAAPVTFVIGVRDEFAQHLCQNRYYRLIHRVLGDVLGEPCQLRFEVVPAAQETPLTSAQPPLHEQLAQPVTAQSVTDLFEQFVGPVSASHTRAIKHLESHYTLADVSYAFEVMAGKQAQGLVDDPLSYTFGVLRKLVRA